VRLLHRLTDTSTDCSIRAPSANKQLNHLKEAEDYGQALLRAARESANRRMVLQAEFMVACVAVWKICTQATSTADERNRAGANVQDCFDALSREPSLHLDNFESRRQVFLGYLAQV
jgi:hypothetical protein